MHHRARPSYDRRVTAEMVGMGVRGQHRRDLSTELLADDLQRLLRARLVEPGVDEHDLSIVIDEHPDIHTARDHPDAIAKRYQHSQSCLSLLDPSWRAAAPILVGREGT